MENNGEKFLDQKFSDLHKLELPKKIGGNFEHNIENYEENINLLENAKNKAIKMEIFKKEFMDDLSFIFVSDVQKEEDGLTNNQLMADEKLIPIDEKKLNSAKDVLLPTKNFVKNLYSFSEKVDNMHQSSRIWLENIDFKSLYFFDAVAVHEIAHTKSYKSITENNQLSFDNKKFRNLIEKIIRASNHLQKMKNIDFSKFDFSVNDWSELYALLYQREFLIKENPDNKKLVSKWDKHTFETANNLSNAIKNLNWEINKKIDPNLIYKDCHAFSFLLAREFENIFRDFDKMIKTLESCKKE